MHINTRSAIVTVIGTVKNRQTIGDAKFVRNFLTLSQRKKYNRK